MESVLRLICRLLELGTVQLTLASTEGIITSIAPESSGVGLTDITFRPSCFWDMEVGSSTREAAYRLLGNGHAFTGARNAHPERA